MPLPRDGELHPTRSQEVPATAPHSKGSAPPPPPEPEGGDSADVRRVLRKLAESAGVTIAEPMDKADIQRLRRPPSSYGPIIDDAARQLESDGDRLHLTSVSASGLHDAYTRRKHLQTCESALYRLYRSCYEQRMQLDDDIIGKLLLIERRVESMVEEDPLLADNWAFLTDYLSDFRRKGAAPAETPPAEEPPADKATNDGGGRKVA